MIVQISFSNDRSSLTPTFTKIEYDRTGLFLIIAENVLK